MEALPNVSALQKRKEQLDARISEPDFFKDRQKAAAVSREHASVQKTLALHHRAAEAFEAHQKTRELISESGGDAELKTLAEEELAALEKSYTSLRAELLGCMLPESPEDSRNTIVEIRAGAGGDEASLFVADLHRLYTRYADTQGWKIEALHARPSEAGGFKELAFLIKGQDVYKALKFESGVHRVQRIPTTESSGRIHTSTVSVAVLPEAEAVELNLKPEELDITTTRASGAGGQHVNKTESAVQIIHKPTGTTVYCADERSQHRNREKAMKVLCARLLERKQAAASEKYAEARRGQIGSADRSERIRTYNFPQGRLSDHRISLNLHGLPEIMEGNLSPLLKALQQADAQARLEAFFNADAKELAANAPKQPSPESS